MSLKVFEQEDEDTWVLNDYALPEGRTAIRVSAFKDEGDFSIEDIGIIEKSLAGIDQLILAAAELILENYSRDYFSSIGIDESLLPSETVESIVLHITLTEAYFFDLESNGFQLSFSSTWDPHHSFDVEFEDGQAQSCAVNG